MGYNITIDQGNSAAKVCVWRADKLVASSVHHPLTALIINDIAHRFSPIDAAIFSTVSDSDTAAIDALRSVCPKVISLSHATPMPLHIAYRTPQSLGHDRIAAMVGAVTLFPRKNIFVVDAGTAITYDIASDDATFTGGNIAPGINMRLEALHSFTARLPLASAEGDTPLFGYDTYTALRAGAVRGVVAEISQYFASLRPHTVMVLTGGDAHLISQFLDTPHSLEPNLVSIGLNSIINYNENI